MIEKCKSHYENQLVSKMVLNFSVVKYYSRDLETHMIINIRERASKYCFCRKEMKQY